jgi:hypothetical protein
MWSDFELAQKDRNQIREENQTIKSFESVYMAMVHQK